MAQTQTQQAFNQAILRVAKVVDVETASTQKGTDGHRIKAIAADSDNPVIMDNLPWIPPLLPMLFQVIPHAGESVLLLTAKLGNEKSQQFYIGPIIPQPQNLQDAPSEIASSNIEGGISEPGEKISNDAATHGSFPDEKTIGLIGRGAEDVQLKFNDKTAESEILLRAGARTYSDKYRSYVNFNSDDPAFIQMKHAPRANSDSNGVINIVADKINIISTQDTDVNGNLCKSGDMISTEDVPKITEKLHPAVKGDALIELLTIMKGAILGHVHNANGLPQSGDWAENVNALIDSKMQEILSDHVKLS